MNDMSTIEQNLTEENNKYYVYIYYDPRNNLPFYVGKGCNNRMYVHLKETEENTENIFKVRRINSIRKDGLEPIITKFKENMTEMDAYDLEYELIKQYGREGIDEGGILTNICLDCQPPSSYGKYHALGSKHSEESKRLRSERVTGEGNPFFGKTHSEENKELISKAVLKTRHLRVNELAPNFGKKHSEETKQRIKETLAKTRSTMTPYVHSEETLQKMKDNHWKSQNWLITFPDGHEETIRGLYSFCEDNKLSKSSMLSVANGLYTQHKGYKCKRV